MELLKKLYSILKKKWTIKTFPQALFVLMIIWLLQKIFANLINDIGQPQLENYNIFTLRIIEESFKECKKNKSKVCKHFTFNLKLLYSNHQCQEVLSLYYFFIQTCTFQKRLTKNIHTHKGSLQMMKVVLHKRKILQRIQKLAKTKISWEIFKNQFNIDSFQMIKEIKTSYYQLKSKFDIKQKCRLEKNNLSQIKQQGIFQIFEESTQNDEIHELYFPKKSKCLGNQINEEKDMDQHQQLQQDQQSKYGYLRGNRSNRSASSLSAHQIRRYHWSQLVIEEWPFYIYSSDTGKDI